MIEGVILVATPALVRDFSPQLGRASAMGFWKFGPVVGSLVVAIVSSNTVDDLRAWQDQFIICGIVGLVIGVVALFGLKELSPQLRDQLMVSLRDRAVIEARARGINVEDSLRRPWRQMMHLDIIGSAFAISVFLLVYYTAVGFFTVYFTALHGFTLSKANSIGDWFWAFDAIALILIGIISDRVRVRKPFMVIGAIGGIVMTIVFLNLGAKTSYATFAVVISVLAVFLAIAYAPWMASFTETVEKRNPALTATGLAVWVDHPRGHRDLGADPALRDQLDDAAGDLRHPGRHDCCDVPAATGHAGRDRSEHPGRHGGEPGGHGGAGEGGGRDRHGVPHHPGRRDRTPRRPRRDTQD